jgi:hypothetical protein
MTTERAELITLQKRLVEELKENIYNTVGRNDSALDRYYRDYQRQFKHGYERLSSRSEIVERLMRANIAYFGDFHTLRSAQSAVLDLLQGAVERGRKVVLALEMLHAADKQEAQEFMDGETDDETFRWRVKWDEKWGFPWASYKRFFAFAKTHDAPLFGININADDREGDLNYRDHYSADLISSLTQLYPERLIAVVYGDLHLAQNHLPHAVDTRLAKYGAKRRTVTIYQNSESLYWKLVEERLEHVVDYIKMTRDQYVVMNATPLVKFQSYANWQDQRQELIWEHDALDLRTDTGLLEQVHHYVQTICTYLDIKLEEDANFEVYTASDLDLLEDLVKRGVYTSTEMAALKDYLAMTDSAFFERARVLYVANLTVANAAEGAARYVLSEVRPVSNAPVVARDEFYARCMVEALAFFCSKIIDPRRHARNADDWDNILKDFGRKRKLDRIRQLDVATAKGFVLHRQYERKVLETGNQQGAPRSLFGLPTDRHVALTRALGRALGDRLYSTLESGISKQIIREAFFDELRKPDKSRNRYFQLLKLTRAGSTTQQLHKHERPSRYSEEE